MVKSSGKGSIKNEQLRRGFASVQNCLFPDKKCGRNLPATAVVPRGSANLTSYYELISILDTSTRFSIEYQGGFEGWLYLLVYSRWTVAPWEPMRLLQAGYLLYIESPWSDPKLPNNNIIRSWIIRAKITVMRARNPSYATWPFSTRRVKRWSIHRWYHQSSDRSAVCRRVVFRGGLY